MPKRVLYIQGISEIGGAERDLLRLLERLDRQRFEPFAVCPPKGPLPGEIQRLKATVHPMNLPSWRKFKDLPFIPWTVLFLFKLLRDLKIDLVHVNDYWWGPMGYLASKMARVPCIVHIRQEIEPGRIKQYWFKKPQRMIAVSNRIRTVAVDAGVDPARILVVYSGIDASLNSGSDRGEKVREKYKLAAGQPVIGTVANLFPRKGYEYLIEAIVEVRKKIPDVHCLIVGDGDTRYREKLLKMVETKSLKEVVTFTGFQHNIIDYIDAADLFVLPSVLEGFGIVLLEAMNRGKPVVATTAGGIPEVVEDGVTGLLVPPKNPAALANKIIYLMEDPALRQKLGVAGRARVLEHFSIERTVFQLQNVYDELILNNRGSLEMEKARLHKEER